MVALALALAATIFTTVATAQDIYSVDGSTSWIPVASLPEDDGVFPAEYVDDDISTAEANVYSMIRDPDFLKNEQELEDLIEVLGHDFITDKTRDLIRLFHDLKDLKEFEGHGGDNDGTVHLEGNTDDNISGEEDLENNTDLDNISTEEDFDDNIKGEEDLKTNIDPDNISAEEDFDDNISGEEDLENNIDPDNISAEEDFDDNINGEEDLENNIDLDNISAEDDLEDTESHLELDEDLIRQLVSDLNFESNCGEECDETPDDDATEEETILNRKKRSPGPRRYSSSSSRSSSSSSSSSRSGGLFGRRRTSSSSSRGRSRSSSSRYGSGSSSSGSTSRVSSSGSTSRGSSSGSTSRVSNSGSTSGSSSSGSSSNPSYGWNTGTSGGSSSGSSTSGAAVATGVGGAGVIAGATSGSGYPSGTKPAAGYPTGTTGGSGYPSGTNPVAGYPTGSQPSGGYPTGTKPVAGYPSGTGTAGGYPTGTQPVPGYPSGTNPGAGYPTRTQPSGGYPTGTQPVAGYPSGTGTAGGYPTGTQPVPGYPSGTRPVGGYPTGTQPVPGYPSGTRPVGGYPTGTQPVPGYPSGTRPVGGYPTGTQPGYPTATHPFGSHPSGNQPFGSYPTGSHSYGGHSTFHQPRQSYPVAYQPYGGYPTATQHRGFPTAGIAAGGFAAGGFAARGFGGYPIGGYPMPKKKKSKKDKVKEVIKTAVAGYALHKAKKKNKFLSPSHLSGYGHSHSRYGSKLGMAGLGGLAVAKTGKKILGAYVKIQIAKYALKFGAEAAKAYFRYKLGLELDEYMIGKFVHRYHQHRVKGDNRWRYYRHHSRNRQNGRVENEEFSDNITLGEFCRRPCLEGDNRICQFSFDVHLYQTLSRACYDCPRNSSDCERPQCVAADGTRRMVTVVNKAIPGPAIQVCVGDKVLVDVMNHLPSTAVSLHWHGLSMGASRAMPNARATPYMDGATGVTQCPIPPGSGFRYAFFASEPGTHFWHAHTGLERGDGLFGPVIVHQPTSVDPNQFLAEHLITINDWFHKPTQSLYAQRHSSGQVVKPSALLINGKGPQQHDAAGGSAAPRVPYAKLLVQNGTRYRLRLINAATTNCPVTVTVDNHDLILLAVDGASVSPVNASAILINPGERYDAMFAAEQESTAEGDTYWVRVTGGGECASLSQYAALQYLPTSYNASEPLPTVPSVVSSTVNPSPGAEEFSGRCGSPGQRCVSGLRASLPLPEQLKQPRMNVTFYLAFTSKYIHNHNLYSFLYYDISQEDAEKRVATPQINNLSFRPPPKPLLINRRPLKSENCSSEGVRQGQCSADYCECIHALNVPLGSHLDLVLIGEGPADGPVHPVHLHGHKFWVLSQVGAEDVPETAPNNTTLTGSATDNGTLPENPTEAESGAGGENDNYVSEFLSRAKVMQLDAEGKLVRNLEYPVAKDSVTVPPGGYTILRLATDNPGVWLLESQVLFDAQAGMALVLHVGAADDVPKSPPPDFPTC